MLTNITAKRRKSWLLAASALASSLGVSEPALADECGALDASGSVTCTNQFNPYPAGITYFRIQPGDLTVNLEKDVTVSLQTAGTAVFVTNNFSGNAIVQDLGATITATVPAPAGVGNEGIHALSLTGSAIVTSSGKITLGNSDGENAIGAFAGGGTASVTYTGPGLISHGNESQGIQAFNFGNGTAIIEASGNVEVSGPSASVIGLVAHAGGDNDASVTYHSGTINVSGGPARGILAWVDGNGSPTATTDAGTFINVNGAGPGVYVFSGTATEANGQKLIANVASTITGVGTGALGIKAFSGADAPIFVTYTGPGIATAGANGHGIAGLSGSGSVNVTSTGPITTNGSGAFGILADSGTIASRTTFNGAPGGEPIVVTPSVGGAPGGSIVVTTSGQGSITTQGVESHGIWATSTTGTVQVSTINVSTTGEFSAGINAAGGGGTTVNVASGGSVMGGWQPDVTSVGPTYGLPAAGVILGSSVGTATLTNNGSIGALSDRAVANSPLFPSNNTSIINNGLITGFVQFTGDNNSVLNNGTFNLRHFADTTGSGSDTLRVAIADIGTGTSNSFTNVGMLALLGASGATKLDATGQYIPLGNVNNEMALGGPLQGHLIGVTTFTNSGTIDLQSNPVAGDVLVITSARQAGVAGLGTFVSNGGLLKLDTVLNEGGPATRSDTLVVDGTSVGANGATNMLISNAGGAGALTVGDGILVVQVLNPNRSAAGVFSLGGPVEAGAFSYLLFRGGVDPGASGNWYLRSTLTCSLTPTLPQCRPPVTGGGGEGGETPTPGPVIPNFRPAVPLYTALSPLAAQYGFSALGTLHERTGDPYAMVDPGGGARAAHAVYLKAVPAAAPRTDSPAIWGRLLGEVGKRDNDNFLSAGPDYTWNFGGLQSGFDLWHREGRDGARDHAGVYGTFGAIGADVQRVFRELGPSAGTISMNAVSFGGYWTHYGPTGWYVDAVTQGTWYDSDARSATGPALHTKGLGWAGSLEGGYPIALAGHLFLEPQAQLIYQRVRLNDGNDGDALVSFDNSDALQGRLGARLVKTWDVGAPTQPRPLDTWLRANLWHEFLNGTDTTFAGLTGANAITFAAPLKGTWAEIGGGATGAIAPNTTLFATTAYQHNIDGNHQFAWTGRAGVTMRW